MTEHINQAILLNCVSKDFVELDFRNAITSVSETFPFFRLRCFYKISENIEINWNILIYALLISQIRKKAKEATKDENFNLINEAVKGRYILNEKTALF